MEYKIIMPKSGFHTTVQYIKALASLASNEI